MGKHDMKRGISQRSSDAGGYRATGSTSGDGAIIRAGKKKRLPNREQRVSVGQTWLGLLVLLLVATCCVEATSDDCLDCFLLAEESEQPYELTMEASAEAGLSETGPTELVVEVLLRHPNSTCRWEHSGPLAGDLYALYDDQLEGRCVRTGAIHHEEDALERTFYCFDADLLLTLCKLRKETELRRLERMATQRRKRDYHPTGCSLNNLLSTNRKVYEFGLENEGLKPTSQIILSTIFLVTDVLSEFYNRRIAGYGGPGGASGTDSGSSVPPKGNPPIEVILLQTIKHQILHKLGLRERPRLTKHLNNEYVFEAFDRIYGNRINIGNSYAEEHYYRRYLTANLSSDLSGDFVDAFFRGPEGREAGERNPQSPQPKQKSTKTGKQTASASTADQSGGDKHNLFAGTKILSYAEKG